MTGEATFYRSVVSLLFPNKTVAKDPVKTHRQAVYPELSKKKARFRRSVKLQINISRANASPICQPETNLDIS